MSTVDSMSLIHPIVQILVPSLLTMVSDTVKLEKVFDPKVLASGLGELVKGFDFSQVCARS